MDSPVPPPEEKTTRSSVELPDWMWAKLKQMAASHRHTSSRSYTRDELLQWLLSWAFREYDLEMKRRAMKAQKPTPK